MIYTKAAMEDIDQLTELRIAYLAEEHGELAEKDLEIIKRDLPDYFMRNLNKNIFCYVARNERKIVACALLLVIEKPMSPAFITGKTGTVLNVYTKPQYQRKGYAKEIMKKLLFDAAEKNLNVMELKATEAGRRLYQSVSFADEVSKYRSMKWRNRHTPTQD